MSGLQDLSYAITQVAHNFGAACVVGAAAYALIIDATPAKLRKCAWLAASGWAVQALSGTAFGAISYYFYAKFPDIHGIAIAALCIKLLCVVVSAALLLWYLTREASWEDARRLAVWRALGALGATALTAAAFLRWFS